MGESRTRSALGPLLVVEDDEGTRTSLCRILRHEGFEVHAFGTGDAALAWIRIQSLTPKAVLLDMILAGTDAQAVAQELRRELPSPVPIIAVSAFPLGRETADAIGCFEFVYKAFDIEALLATVRRALEKR